MTGAACSHEVHLRKLLDWRLEVRARLVHVARSSDVGLSACVGVIVQAERKSIKIAHKGRGAKCRRHFPKTNEVTYSAGDVRINIQPNEYLYSSGTVSAFPWSW